MTSRELLLGFSPYIHDIHSALELIHYSLSHLLLPVHNLLLLLLLLLLSSLSLASSPLARTAADGAVGQEFVDLVGSESSRGKPLAFPLIVLIAGQSELGGVVGIVDAFACDDEDGCLCRK